MAAAGVPDRVTVGEAVLQELLLEAFSAWSKQGRDFDLAEHRVVASSIKRLLELKKLDGKTPQYTKDGVMWRLDTILSELTGRPKPDGQSSGVSWHGRRG